MQSMKERFLERTLQRVGWVEADKGNLEGMVPEIQPLNISMTQGGCGGIPIAILVL